MNRSDRWFRYRSILFWTLYLTLLLVPAAFEPLFETTEGRYAEIAREMVASGNYLEPRLNGILHFHKPPLAYWMMAAGIKLFGVNNFGVRFFSVMAAGLAVYFLYRLAKLLLRDDRTAFDAALIFASSGLFLAISRLVSTDIYLTCFVLGAQYFLFRQISGSRSRWNVVGFAAGLGLGFLTKGPVVLLFTLLPFWATKLVSQDRRRVFSWKETVVGAAFFS